MLKKIFILPLYVFIAVPVFAMEKLRETDKQELIKRLDQFEATLVRSVLNLTDQECSALQIIEASAIGRVTRYLDSHTESYKGILSNGILVGTLRVEGPLKGHMVVVRWVPGLGEIGGQIKLSLPMDKKYFYILKEKHEEFVRKSQEERRMILYRPSEFIIPRQSPVWYGTAEGITYTHAKLNPRIACVTDIPASPAKGAYTELFKQVKPEDLHNESFPSRASNAETMLRLKEFNAEIKKKVREQEGETLTFGDVLKQSGRQIRVIVDLEKNTAKKSVVREKRSINDSEEVD